LRNSVGLAFRELLLNAVEWGGTLDAAKRVRVVRARARGVLIYRITDPGPGFRVDDLPHAAVAAPQNLSGFDRCKAVLGQSESATPSRI
jgi:anti-sigma regulatory factor (Ser/Thr protein kinase)